MENVWSKNVIVTDAAFIDRVAFNLTVNFERMLGRRVPPADMARWAECVAMDGGLREGENAVQVVLVHDERQTALPNFQPSHLEKELSGQAFRSPLGEFTFQTLTGASLSSKEEVLLDLAGVLMAELTVERIVLIPDSENAETMFRLRQLLRQVAPQKPVTCLTMQPTSLPNCLHEQLGYSLLQALGISSEEIEQQTRPLSPS